MNRIKMPKHVKFIIEMLENNGFEAYAVGGCVRDAILGREPNDWDITTSAMPDEVKKLFRRTIDTGIKHGTVTVMIDKKGYEVTTYRIDGEYQDGRHPLHVEFTRNLIEDLKRRDFTINAMAYNDREGIVDIFGGVRDLKDGIIRCVGNPADRFSEDALRILRAVRFSASLGFRIDDNTCRAIEELAVNLEKISRERIQAELEKLLMSDNPDRLKAAYELGITTVVFREIDRIAAENELTEVLSLVKLMPKEHFLRWSAVLSRAGKDKAANILRDFKFDNKTVNVVSKIIGEIGRPLPQTRGLVRRDIYEIGEDIYEIYLTFMEVYLPFYYAKAGQSDCMKETLANVKKEYNDIIEKGDCISLKALAVNGKDLMEAGLARGEQVGEALKRLLYVVLENNDLNRKEILLEMLDVTKY